MRIAFIVGRFPSISETFILNQITGLIDAGHEVDIFAYHRSDDNLEHTDIQNYNLLEQTHYINIPKARISRALQGGKVMLANLMAHPLEVSRSLDVSTYGREATSLSLLLTLCTFLEKSPYDILNCHFGKQGLTGMRLKQLGIAGKLVVTFHGYDVSQLIDEHGHDVYESLFETADLMLPVSEFWKRKLISMGAMPERVQVHHMGIDVNRFEFLERKIEHGEQVKLFTVGRLVEKKGIENSIRALAEVVSRQPGLNIRYQIIGDGPLRADLEELAQSLGLDQMVQFTGAAAQDEVRKKMRESHLFLLPSITGSDGDQEGIPVSMMEAMATGMPIISTYHSGIPELVEDGKSGYLVPEKDVAGLADRLEQMIQHADMWPEMGCSGRKVVERHFNIYRLNNDLICKYQHLLDHSEC